MSDPIKLFIKTDGHYVTKIESNLPGDPLFQRILIDAYHAGTKAELTLSYMPIEIEAVGFKLLVFNPNTRQHDEVRRIEFADGSTWEADAKAGEPA